MKILISAFALTAFMASLGGCGKSSSQPSKEAFADGAATPSTSTASAAKEEYEEIDSVKLGLDIQGGVRSVVSDLNGTVYGVEGRVTKFTVHGQKIALLADKLGVEDKRVVVSTKDYGKILLSFGVAGATQPPGSAPVIRETKANGTKLLTLPDAGWTSTWMMPSQKRQFEGIK